MSSEKLTPEKMEEIRARCDAATPGPWTEWRHAMPPNLPSAIYGEDGEPVLVVREPYGQQAFLAWTQPDKEFALNARTDVPLLLDRIAELEKALEQAIDLTGLRLDMGMIRWPKGGFDKIVTSFDNVELVAVLRARKEGEKNA